MNKAKKSFEKLKRGQSRDNIKVVEIRMPQGVALPDSNQKVNIASSLSDENTPINISLG